MVIIRYTIHNSWLKYHITWVSQPRILKNSLQLEKSLVITSFDYKIIYFIGLYFWEISSTVLVHTKDSVRFVRCLLLLIVPPCMLSSANTDRLVLKLNVRDFITPDNVHPPFIEGWYHIVALVFIPQQKTIDTFKLNFCCNLLHIWLKIDCMEIQVIYFFLFTHKLWDLC